MQERRRSVGEILDRGTRPRVDSPTYLRITGRISEEEYQRRLDERRVRIGLPPIQRERPAAG